MQVSQADLDLMRMLAGRLERLSADSAWAHRASGVRGNLLRLIDEAEAGHVVQIDVDKTIEIAFKVLLEGAREMRRK